MRIKRLTLSIGVVLGAAIAACTSSDRSSAATRSDSASSAQRARPPAQAPPSDITPVRGTVLSVNESDLTVTTATGDVHILIDAPLHVFARVASDLAHVTATSFVGVTSEKQADGSERATEIHIFPEELRGTGEGSYLMQQPGAHDSARSTMTNGTVKAAKPSAAPRMTNGAVASRNGETLTVDYHGGSQTISVPADVKVTALAPAATKLTSGVKVVVIAKKQPDGSLKASNVVLASEPSK
ncbi:MAG: hypothetical protein H0U66_15460 [Gemmatimonadaceae bacterium]|nr:hypothetical protein [Gemmatimonadaceae bacterium]